MTDAETRHRWISDFAYYETENNGTDQSTAWELGCLAWAVDEVLLGWNRDVLSGKFAPMPAWPETLPPLQQRQAANSVIQLQHAAVWVPRECAKSQVSERVRSPLTPEQRERKNALSRQRRIEAKAKA